MTIMKKTTYTVFALTLGAFIAAPSVVLAEDVTRCFESRKGDEMAGGGHTSIDVKEVEPGWPNVKCSDTTGGVLWWGDPFTDTEPMGDMPENIDADYLHEEAVVRPRADKLMYNMPCVACHNEGVAPPPANNDPRLLSSPMYAHEAYAPRDPKDFKHGNGAIWCLDCHSRTNRDALIDHRGNEISFNQPQKLCGKCHGPVYRDWRDGIHGKRIGMWDKGGKKRWWVCTECHNPHDTQPGFKPIVPEPPPELPKGMENADHERHHGPVDHGTTAASGDAH
jgi:hypothetical protein